MLKGMFFLLLILLAWGLFRSRSREAGREGRRDADAPKADNMVACAHCRVYLPSAEALRRDGNAFCSEEHYARWKRQSAS